MFIALCNDFCKILSQAVVLYNMRFGPAWLSQGFVRRWRLGRERSGFGFQFSKPKHTQVFQFANFPIFGGVEVVELLRLLPAQVAKVHLAEWSSWWSTLWSISNSSSVENSDFFRHKKNINVLFDILCDSVCHVLKLVPLSCSWLMFDESLCFRHVQRVKWPNPETLFPSHPLVTRQQVEFWVLFHGDSLWFWKSSHLVV